MGGCCPPETDAQFCANAGVLCGPLSGTDNCGQSRTANCGTCSGCGAASTVAPTGGVYSGTTSGGSLFNSTCGAAVDSAPEAYFTWTPTVSGPATVSTCGSSFDTVLDVLSGSCPGGALVGCNDNTAVWCYGSTTDSLIDFSAVAGTTYYFVVDGNGTASGNYTLKVVSPGGTCSSPFELPSAGGSFSSAFNGNNQGDTGSCGGAGADRVHHWVPSNSVTATITLTGDFWPAALYVRSGSCQGTEVACNYQTAQWPTETVTFSVTAGLDYYVWIAHGTYTGDAVMMYTLNVTAP